MIEHLPLRNLFPKGVIETKMAVLKALDKSCTEHISYITKHSTEHTWAVGGWALNLECQGKISKLEGRQQ